jgi:hypothetical protein
MPFILDALGDPMNFGGAGMIMVRLQSLLGSLFA